MTNALAYTNSAIMALLGLLHLYWAAGGRWGIEQAIPTDQAGNQTLRTGILACLIVGFGLLGFAAFYISLTQAPVIELPFSLETWGSWALAFIFNARAIGDFKQVGFFKKIKDTEFGKMDTRWYSPICLYLGLSSIWIGMNT